MCNWEEGGGRTTGIVRGWQVKAVPEGNDTREGQESSKLNVFKMLRYRGQLLYLLMETTTIGKDSGVRMPQRPWGSASERCLHQASLSRTATALCTTYITSRTGALLMEVKCGYIHKRS